MEVQISKKCTPLWCEAHLEVKMLKTLGVRTTFGGSDVASLRFTTIHYIALHYTTLHYATLPTLHYTPQHYNYNYTTTLHYTPLNYTTLSPLKLAPWGQTPLYRYRMGALKKAYKMDGHQEFAWIQNGRAQSEP